YPLMTRDGVFFIDSRIRIADITDGTSHTFLLGERYHWDPEFDRINVGTAIARAGSWGPWAWVGSGAMGSIMLGTHVPINYRVPPSAPVGDLPTIYDRFGAFGSGHPGGANCAFADGSVRFLSDRIDLATPQALSTRAGAEVVTPP